MSSFIQISDSGLWDESVPLASEGSTCEAFIVKTGGKLQFLKKLKDEFMGKPKYIALLEREFEVGASLTHPNLVKYNEFHNDSHGVYILQDYVAGQTLRRKIEENPAYFLDSWNLRRFIIQLLECLDYLHSNQIVHCDLNQDNLMFTQVDGSLKVIDLGFCYTDVYREFSGMNDCMGTPEQMKCDFDSISARTDLYSVGKIIQLIEDKVYRPAGCALPKVFSRLAAKCTEGSPDRRPASAKECMHYLRRSRTRVLLMASSLLLIAAILFLCINPSAKKVVRYAVRNIHMSAYDISDRSGNLYRIISEKDATCEAAGYQRLLSIDNPEVVIHSSVTHFGKEYKVVSIADKAYLSDTTITSAFVPEGIRKIGQQAFRGCKYLHSLTLPSTIEEIGEDCFAHDTLLRQVLLPRGLKVLENNCFVDCHSLQSIAIPEGVKTIEMDCFVSCRSLKNIMLPDGLETISRGVFFNCDALESITIPASVSIIGDYAFYGCKSLQDVYVLNEKPFPIASVFNTPGLVVHVPAESLQAYRSTPGWENLTLVCL